MSRFRVQNPRATPLHPPRPEAAYPNRPFHSLDTRSPDRCISPGEDKSELLTGVTQMRFRAVERGPWSLMQILCD